MALLVRSTVRWLFAGMCIIAVIWAANLVLVLTGAILVALGT